VANERINRIQPEEYQPEAFDLRDQKRLAPRVPFSRLLEAGYINPGQTLFFKEDPDKAALVKPNGILVINGYEGSIHQTARHILGGKRANGWLYWYIRGKDGSFRSIDAIREDYRSAQPDE
jgi:modification methylase